MQDTEVHSLILGRVDEIDDEEMRSFLRRVLAHERDILQEPRAEYKDTYKELVDKHVDNQSLAEFSDE